MVEHLRETSPQHECVVLDAHTKEYDFGWVFCYDTRAYIEKGLEDSQLMGNAPYLVDARTGAIFTTGTGRPISYYVANYRLRGDPHRAHPLQGVADLIDCLCSWIVPFRSH